MAFSVKDKATDEAVRRLAKLKNTSLTEAIREAVVHEYERSKKETPLQEKLSKIFEEYRKYPKTGLEADKAFFDDLSGNE
ncbi:type II toxin-antitoxin system VapB family antitoxin [Phyllobacterium lublinensis]|jgi:antitoxin VapB|uniref:type II toxin-antitoxin system VapB family antitoxin n=1 Tax=Phyllobacterium lublinensis TaxID=2875708 RepID=UPI001CCA9982|nr:type II toxin-antitoxin system VapB family antitoxin [Phyllobacterium sp. 2063]MBZ9657145.1 type II toxin-antitoxin system VapB family antitoxin [Phyllobacterium sp. 2063]